MVQLCLLVSKVMIKGQGNRNVSDNLQWLTVCERGQTWKFSYKLCLQPSEVRGIYNRWENL